MSAWSLRVEGLGKRFRIGKPVRYKTLRDSIAEFPGRAWRSTASLLTGRRDRESDKAFDGVLWALRDVSFDVKSGEAVGIIGRNGAGKSTLLKILSRITEPTEGYADIQGRAGALLEVGTGFHPELTGRENIFLNGAILGMSSREIARKFDAIVDFAGVAPFIDTPIKHYSSGMFVRLAFAVAAHLEPEILIVDEVLAVGDLAFQQKCLGKMAELSGGGRTVLFVSHNLSAIASLCPTSIWLEAGRVAYYGKSSQAIARYVGSLRLAGGASLADRKDRRGSGRVRITRIELEDAQGATCDTARSGQGIRVLLEYLAQHPHPLEDVAVKIVFADTQGHRLFSCFSAVSGAELRNLPSQGKLVCFIPELPLCPGYYDLHLSCVVNRDLVDKVMYAASLVVEEGDFFGTGRGLTDTEYHGSVLVRHAWSAEPVAARA